MSMELNSIAAQKTAQPARLPLIPEPPVQEPKPRCVGPLFFGDFLYWKASSEMPFAETSKVLDTPLIQLNVNGHIQEIHFDYDPGFRIGAGCWIKKSWDVKGDWLRFRTSNSKTLIASDDTLVNLVWSFLPLFNTVSDVTARQTIQIDRAQFDFIKKMMFGPNFFFDAVFGAFGVWIEQSMHLAANFLDPVFLPRQNTHLKNHFQGGGLQIGLRSEYAPICSFGFYGEGRLSLAYGQFSLSDNEQLISSFPGFENIVSKKREYSQAVVCSCDLRGGIRGSYRFKDRYELSGHISYEFSYWPNFSRNRFAFNNLPSNGQIYTLLGFGDLGFHGISTGLGMSF